MKIHCKYDELVKIENLKPHPKNRNTHSEEQIVRLAKLLNYQGMRAPIVVSKLSGHMVKGHGTLMAVVKNGWKEVPVVYQSFESIDQEYAFVQSDNAIAAWSELDQNLISVDMGELNPNFDIELLGIEDFKVELAEMPDLTAEESVLTQMTFTLHKDQAADIERAMDVAKGMGDFLNTQNENSNGNALARVAEMFLGEHGNS